MSESELTFLQEFSSDVDRVARRMAVAPISQDEFAPRLRGVYKLPHWDGPLGLNYVVAEVYGSYGDEPSDYSDFVQISLVDDLPDADQIREQELLRDNIITITPENGDITFSIGNEGYETRPDRIFKAQRFMGWLKPMFENGRFTHSPVTEAAHRRLTDMQHLESQASTVFDKWSEAGMLTLDTYVSGHQTLVIEDGGKALHILTDWMNVVEDPATATIEDAVRMRGRTTLLVGKNDFGFDRTIETQGGSTTGLLEEHSKDDVLLEVYQNTILINQMLELANEYNIATPSEP